MRAARCPCALVPWRRGTAIMLGAYIFDCAKHAPAAPARRRAAGRPTIHRKKAPAARHGGQHAPAHWHPRGSLAPPAFGERRHRALARDLDRLAAPSCGGLGSHWDRCGVHYVKPIEGAR
jgi:hypothetical protein